MRPCVYTKGTACPNEATHYCVASHEDYWTHWTVTDKAMQLERVDGMKLTRGRVDANGKPVLDAHGLQIIDPLMHTLVFCQEHAAIVADVRNGKEEHHE